MGLISSPLRIIVAMVMLYFELGFASLVALAVLLLLMPTQVQLSCCAGCSPSASPVAMPFPPCMCIPLCAVWEEGPSKEVGRLAGLDSKVQRCSAPHKLLLLLSCLLSPMMLPRTPAVTLAVRQWQATAT